jgi:hypothetical protein
MSDIHRVTIRIPAELDAQLKELAEAEERSLSSQIVFMLQAAVDAGVTPIPADVLSGEVVPDDAPDATEKDAEA